MIYRWFTWSNVLKNMHYISTTLLNPRLIFLLSFSSCWWYKVKEILVLKIKLCFKSVDSFEHLFWILLWEYFEAILCVLSWFSSLWNNYKKHCSTLVAKCDFSARLYSLQSRRKLPFFGTSVENYFFSKPK